MSFPCAPMVPMLPGEPNLQLLIPPLLVPVLPPEPPLPSYVQPRFVSDFPLRAKPTLFWLAVLARASYAPNSALIARAAHAVLPGEYPVTFVANVGLTPGFTIIKLPHGAIVVISGTTNLGQWQEQIFNNGMVEVGAFHDYQFVKAATMPVYLTAALAIDTAVKAAVPNAEQLLIVGHSMGGAVAQVLAGIYQSVPDIRVAPRVVTFASPKPGDIRLTNFMRTGGQVFQRLITDGDFVPALPPDLGVFNLAVPPAFAAVSTNWNRFKQPGVASGLSPIGELTPIGDPFLPLLVTAAMLSAAVGLPLNLTALHRMQTYTTRLYAGMPGGIPDSSSGVTRSAQEELNSVCLELAVMGL